MTHPKLTVIAAALCAATLVATAQTPLVEHLASFEYQSQFAGMAIDADGNAHIVSGSEANHIGTLEYQRWDASTGFFSPRVTFERGGRNTDPLSVYIAIDDAGRVHIVYGFVLSDGTDSGQGTMYHMIAEDATSSTPLTLAGWSAPEALAIPAGEKVNNSRRPLSGSIVAIGSDTLILARRHETDSPADGPDIRIDKASFNGSTWDWTEIGKILTGSPQGYGGLLQPQLYYVAGKLHMSYYDARTNGYRGLYYTQSSSPTNPTAGTWITPESLLHTDAQYRETKGGIGVLQDGTVVALVWGANNRDNISTQGNFSRVRDPNTGLWGVWQEEFIGDVRWMPQKSGPPAWPQVVMVRDGLGGMFSAYDNTYISQWDPLTTVWSDAFTGLSFQANGNPSGNIGVDINAAGTDSRVYHYNRPTKELLIGTYVIPQENCISCADFEAEVLPLICGLPVASSAAQFKTQVEALIAATVDAPACVDAHPGAGSEENCETYLEQLILNDAACRAIEILLP